MFPDGLVDCRRCGNPTQGYGGAAYCEACEPPRCIVCQRFVRRGQQGVCDRCRVVDGE